MNDFTNLAELDARVLTILIILTVIDLILRGIAMWIAASNKQKGWFIVMLLINTFGILPALYLVHFQPEENEEES